MNDNKGCIGELVDDFTTFLAIVILGLFVFFGGAQVWWICTHWNEVGP